MRRCKEWEMAKGMSKKERKLREEIAELEQKKTRGFMQTGRTDDAKFIPHFDGSNVLPDAKAG